MRPVAFPVVIIDANLCRLANASFEDDIMYVGGGRENGVHPSPWASPFGCSSDRDCNLFHDYAFARADKIVWLAPLLGKRILCCCNNKNNHALVIAKLIMQTFLPDDTANEISIHSSTDDVPNLFSNVVLFDTSLHGNVDCLDWANLPSAPQHPCVVSWPDVWHCLVDEIRSCESKLFWDIFAGTAELTNAFSQNNWFCAPPLDVSFSADYNLLDPLFMAIVIGLILEGRFHLISLSPPYHCNSGGNGILTVCNNITIACNKSCCHALMFMPDTAKEWESSKSSFVSTYLFNCAFVDTCLVGTPWSIRLKFCSSFTGIREISYLCCGDHIHAPLGSSSVLKSPLFKSGEMWPELAQRIARIYEPLLSLHVSRNVSHLAGILDGRTNAPILSTLEKIGFVPCGKRAVRTVADKISTCVQPTRRVAPTIIPEGLGPVAHLKVALSIQHPFLRTTALEPVAEKALEDQHDDPRDLIAFRNEVSKLVSELAAAVEPEWQGWLPFVDERIRPIVGRRNVAFCRELSYCTSHADLLLWPSYVLGLRMIGWAERSAVLPSKTTLPLCEVDDFPTQAEIMNSKILTTIGPSDDSELDDASWAKSCAEFAAETLLGPFKLDELPHNIRLLPRRPIWECHGGKKVRSCRNIDDALFGEQNHSVGLLSVHRPCTVDRLVAKGRRVAKRFPSDELAGWTSDFGGAYKQVPSDPEQSHLFGVAMWNPILQCIVVGMAVSQIFGSRSAPLNFSRYPDWCCFVMAKLYLTALEQCIDDLICMERKSTALSGRSAWLTLAKCCGWHIPLEKSPLPSQNFRALGVFVNLEPLPTAAAEICACQDRLISIGLTLAEVQKANRLVPSLASSIVGKLGFTTCAFAGKYGKSMLRAFYRRASEQNRSNMNPQISSSCQWWSHGLKSAPARPIPWNLAQRDLTISYSDGEGSDAGVGVAIWSNRLDFPQAGRMDIPAAVRNLWASQRKDESGELYDIQEIEGIGPLLVLTTWPDILRGSLWLHFIDNNGALSCLIKGSSSCLGTDTLVGMTWKKIGDLSVLPWFDRVDTKSNPVDGLSRKDVRGPWDLVPLHFPVASLKHELRKAKRCFSSRPPRLVH